MSRHKETVIVLRGVKKDSAEGVSFACPRYPTYGFRILSLKLEVEFINNFTKGIGKEFSIDFLGHRR